MPGASELLRQLDVVVDFAVEDDPQRAVVVAIGWWPVGGPAAPTGPSGTAPRRRVRGGGLFAFGSDRHRRAVGAHDADALAPAVRAFSGRSSFFASEAIPSECALYEYAHGLAQECATLRACAA